MRRLVLLIAVVSVGCGSSSTGSGGGSGASGGGAGAGGGTNSTGGGSGGTGGGGVAAGGGTATGGGSGGSGGAGGGAATGGGGPKGCAGSTYKLCEDFELGNVGATPTGWTALPGYGVGTVGLATDQARSGVKALKSESNDDGQPRVQKNISSLGAVGGTHWGRIFFKVQIPAPKPNTYYHVTFVALREAGNESRVVDTVQDPSGKLQYIYNLPDDSCCNGSAYDYKFDDKWHCVEWHVDVTNNSYQFFLDSVEIPSIGFTNKPAARLKTFTSIAVGNIFYQVPNISLVTWFDDLAINDTKIGCN